MVRPHEAHTVIVIIVIIIIIIVIVIVIVIVVVVVVVIVVAIATHWRRGAFRHLSSSSPTAANPVVDQNHKKALCR